MKIVLSILFATIGLLQASRSIADDTTGIQFEIDSISGRPLPCRVHLTNDRGEPKQPAELPFWKDHFVCDGRATVDVTPGSYFWTIERGPEYESAAGQLNVVNGKESKVEIALKRISSLRNEGWYSGDLHVHRKVEDVEKLMEAEDLDFAPVITWWNSPNIGSTPAEQTLFRFDGHRRYETLAGEDEREGGALLYFGLNRPLDLTIESREFPSPMRFVRQAQEENTDVWIDIEKPFWWDVPTWLASGKMNSIGIANNHMCRSQMYESEAWGRPRDSKRLPAPQGNGFWTQEIYYHMLNAGLRLPPSAGSASGVLPNPVGYNRVYVHLDEPFSRESWFSGLSRGNCFVTNGPLLLVAANERLPGSTLNLTDDKPLQINLSIQLTSRDRVKQLEVIRNGRIEKVVRCDTAISQQQEVQLTMDDPGWFLVRAITDVEHTFRFASTAPWYVENSSDRRVSKASAQFFLDWVDERMDRVRKNVTDTVQRKAVLKPHESAREFWAERVRNANVE